MSGEMSNVSIDDSQMAPYELLRKYKNRCPECKELLMNTPSGSACPNGHRGLFPKVDEWIGGVVIGSRLGVFQEDDRDEDDGRDDDE